MPFSRGVVSAQQCATGSAALPLVHNSVPPCRAHGSVAALPGQKSTQFRSRLWQPWGGRRASAIPPLQPQHVRRWRGLAAMAKGGRQQKKKQDDSELLSSLWHLSAWSTLMWHLGASMLSAHSRIKRSASLG
jgi:hypothetical protein